MQAAEFQKPDICLKYLKPEEVNQPFTVLADFFCDDWLPGHLERLKRWRDCVLKDDFFRGDKNSPAELLYFHRLNLCLIEAIYLLAEATHSSGYVKQMGDVLSEKIKWRDYPTNLDEAELLNPYLVVHEFFADYNLTQYHEKLYNWLECGLSSKAAGEFIETGDLISVYENLQKLYSAAWLIHQRTTRKPFLKNDKGNGAPAVKNLQTELSKKSVLRDITVYQLNHNLSSVPKETITGLISIIKHKVPSVQAIIYLGTPSVCFPKLFLLILTSNDEQTQAQSLCNRVEESCFKIANVVALVHHASELLNALNSDNWFFSDALRCPVIYLSGDLLLPPAKPMSYAAFHPMAQANWEHWHKQGKDFLSGADYYLRIGAADAALFSLHQCAECLLIAVVRAMLGYRVNNHNLSRLLHISHMFTDDLFKLFGLDKLENQQLFELLKHAYINVRYRDTFEADIKSVESLYRVIKELVIVTSDICEKRLMTITL